MTLTKIISGGQTGADQGALDGARACRFPYGGAIPAGRKTETGPLADDYLMDELTSGHYPVRTEKNVADADGTLIVSYGPLRGGSLLTFKIARDTRKPCLHIDFNGDDIFSAERKVTVWVDQHSIKILNVAGPRASSDPKIYNMSRRLIVWLLSYEE